MLLSTFCHIPGIAHATERALWQQGITDWHALLADPTGIPRVSERQVLKTLEDSFQALDSDPDFFISHLKRRDSWRTFPHFRKATAYLDIETTGLGPESGITTIALYDGKQVKTYVNGVNIEEFLDDITEIKVFVTYNGLSFDIPFIERFFRIKITQAQIDLRYILAQLGCKGGLKGCEKQMGISRGTLDGIDGSFAVVLWREYERYNNDAALETLLAYNVEDTVNLERLMVEAYNRNILQTPFAEKLALPYPVPPPLFHQPDPEIIARNQGIYRY